MKSLKKIYPVLLVVAFLFAITDISAQPRHKKHEKARKEYAKKREKAYKSYKKDERKWFNDRRHHDERYRKGRGREVKYVKRNGPPSWAPAHGYRAKHHVYFRDYYTFYDPYRAGYVYRTNNGWRFSRNIPSFMVGVDLGRDRIQLLTDLPLNRHPEQYYDRYAKRYPRDSRIDINIILLWHS